MSQQEETARRMGEQRWLIDKLIEVDGIDFAWPATANALAVIGPDVSPDIMSVRSRVKKYADISREFARAASKRESIAQRAQDCGHLVTARENFFAASILYGIASWPFHEDDNEENISCHAKKTACYDEFIKHAPHGIERVEIPFEGHSLPGILHLPSSTRQKMPCVLAFSGMDALKEYLVPAYGSKFLERGMAVLALDGPGQGDSLLRKIRCTADNFARAGQAAMDYLVRRPEIDATRVGLSGRSMASFWGTQIVAHDKRFAAAAVQLVCHEPGMNSIFNTASPTYKARYMWMAGYDDEDEFDKFAQTLALNGLGSRINCPFLIVAGEDDELSPIEHSYDLYHEIVAPKQLVVFRRQGHAMAGALGWQTMIADWMQDRLEGKAMQSGIVVADDAAGVP